MTTAIVDRYSNLKLFFMCIYFKQGTEEPFNMYSLCEYYLAIWDFCFHYLCL